MNAKQTFALKIAAVLPLFARLQISSCTEILAWDKSTPNDCSALVRLFNNLFNLQTPLYYKRTFR